MKNTKALNGFEKRAKFIFSGMKKVRTEYEKKFPGEKFHSIFKVLDGAGVWENGNLR